MRCRLSSSLAGVLSALSLLTGVVHALTVDSKVLIIGRDDIDVKSTSTGLDAYGIPWEAVMIPKAGGTLPTLAASTDRGNFGSIVLVGSVSYKYETGYASALTPEQWTQIYQYQSTYKVRMVRLNEYPGPNFGTLPADSKESGCCNPGVKQDIVITDSSAFPGANLKANVPVPTDNLFHYPAVITAANMTTPFAHFEPGDRFTERTVAGVINKMDGREQMVFFLPFAPQWSLTSGYLQHSYLHWMTRSTFSGKRKTHLNVQVDDVHLSTGLFFPKEKEFRSRTGDLQAHIEWQRSINSRLPSGSDFWLEMAHNGNGDIISATNKTESQGICIPGQAVDYTSPPDTELEFKKPLGTGTDVWPAEFTRYNWTKPCADMDDLASWFMNPSNRDAFAHVSHTFSHYELNNATHNDATREVHFNQAWLKQTGIDQAQRWSPKGLIPPAITGLHNGDVIRAWTENGISLVVGDNTRPVLRNPDSKYWPLATTTERNGGEGVWIIPRYATTIYYNCDSEECMLEEWKFVSNRTGTFTDLLNDARNVNLPYLLNLQADPYMFHQANLRWIDMPERTLGTETGTFSVIVSWIETIAQELYRLTDWPVVSLKHDDFAQYFLDRMAVDKCKPSVSYTYSSDASRIASLTVTTEGNSCSAPVPVTIPRGSASGGNSRLDTVGSEPPIVWVTMSGSPVTLQLSEPVRL